MRKLKNFQSNPAFMKLLKTFDCEITNIFRQGVRVSDPVRERLTRGLIENLQTNTPDKLDKEFSFFKRPVMNTIPYCKITLSRVFAAVAGDYYKKQTEELRLIQDKKLAGIHKSNNFDYVCFSGTFKKRGNSNLIEHSGLICLDLDNVHNLDESIRVLKDDKHTELLYRSPSGNGIKLIVAINIKKGGSHHDFFITISNYLKENYGLICDPSGRDVARATFLCFSPDAFIHPRNLESNV